MKIALLGYGKMGKVIERIALERGHEIVLKKTSATSYQGIEEATVAIEFSTPETAVANISYSLNAGVPIICGTTGWLESYDEIVSLCNEKKGSFIYASNFSLGVNIFFELNRHLAKIMSPFHQYNVAIEEIHHTQKLDVPSGTAISLANAIISNHNYSNWTLENPKIDEIKVEAKRIENVPGTHSVFYDSPTDTIEIKHSAHNREGFALGAVVAAEWLIGKKGVYAMKDVLNLQS